MTATIIDFPLMVKHLDNPPNRIREWRNARGMKQWQLAEAIGVKQNAISRIEGGDRQVPMHRFRQIAQVLEVDIGQLLSVEDNRMGLDESGLAVVKRLQEAPQLAPTFHQIAETISAYDAGPAVDIGPGGRVTADKPADRQRQRG